MAKKKKEEKKIVFRRIGGKIVPISVASAGLATAASAANTTRVYEKGKVTIDKKKFSFAPVVQKFGSKFDMKVDGKKVATASTYMDKSEKGSMAFGWLGTRKKHRGKGYAKTLSKEAARDAVRHGAKYTESQVIHAGSLKANLSKRDTLFYNFRNDSHGAHFKKITKSKALKHIEKEGLIRERMMRSWAKDVKKSSMFSDIRKAVNPKKLRKSRNLKSFMTDVLDIPRDRVGYQLAKLGKQDSRVFRHTSFKGMKKTTKYSKPFRTAKNKLTIGLGMAAAVGGIYKGVKDEKK